MAEIKEPILCCPHCGQKLVSVEGVGRPAALECSCGYVWYLGEKLKINRQEGDVQTGDNPSLTKYTFTTPQQKMKIKELAEQGMTYKDAADQLKMKKETVAHYYRKYGFGKKPKYITDKQRKKVIKLFKSDKKISQKQIASEVGLCVGSVQNIISQHKEN